MDTKPFALGYVGVGLMGLPMVQRLTNLGWRVRAYDIVAERVAQSGAQACVSAADAARGVDVVLLNLPTNDAVLDAVFNERGLVKTIGEAQLVVDFSTIPVEACQPGKKGDEKSERDSYRESHCTSRRLILEQPILRVVWALPHF